MEPNETTGTTEEGVRAPGARPRIRCPHCRAVDPEINYGELAYYEQPYDPSTEDWTGAGEVVGETDGSSTIIAKCSACDEDITTYLIGWSRRNPDYAPYAHFVHEIYIPRGLPLRRNARAFLAGIEWSHGKRYQGAYTQPTDEELEAAIALRVRELGQLLDEREERTRLKAKEMPDGKV